MKNPALNRKPLRVPLYPAGIYADKQKVSERINFEDNIFILNIRIRMIQNLLLLDTDGDLFRDKTLDDLEFVNTALDSLFARLSENARFVEREEQMHNLAETDGAFQEALHAIAAGDGSVSVRRYPEIRERISFLTAKSRERGKESARASRDAAGSSGAEPLVSPDEMSELLRDME